MSDLRATGFALLVIGLLCGIIWLGLLAQMKIQDIRYRRYVRKKVMLAVAKARYGRMT